MSMISRYLEAEVPDPNLPEDLYAPGAFYRTAGFDLAAGLEGAGFGDARTTRRRQAAGHWIGEPLNEQ